MMPSDVRKGCREKDDCSPIEREQHGECDANENQIPPHCDLPRPAPVGGVRLCVKGTLPGPRPSTSSCGPTLRSWYVATCRFGARRALAGGAAPLICIIKRVGWRSLGRRWG